MGRALSLGIVYAYQRDLIYDEQFVGQLVGCQGELAEAVIAHGFLAVDAFVDCAGGLAGIQGEDFSGAAGGG